MRMFFISILLLGLFPFPISTALYQGDEVTATGFIVALKTPENLCSGALVGERVVVTALGCVLQPGGSLINSLNAIDVYAPDANLISAQPVAKVKDYYTPAFNLISLFPNIVFLVLDKKIGNSPITELATYDKASQFAAFSENFDVFGYGITSDNVPPPFGNVPRKTKAFPNFKKDPYENQKDYFRLSPAICYGDIGAPIITKVGGKTILIGVAFSIQGFDGKCDGKGGSSVTPKISFATIAGEYTNIFSQATRLATELNVLEAEAKAAAEKLIADAKAEAERIVAAKKLIADAKVSADKLAAEKLIADAKAEAERILAAAKAAATKKTIITCTKNKLIKKVTAVKPKCPAGYKVKK